MGGLVGRAVERDRWMVGKWRTKLENMIHFGLGHACVKVCGLWSRPLLASPLSTRIVLR